MLGRETLPMLGRENSTTLGRETLTMLERTNLKYAWAAKAVCKSLEGAGLERLEGARL